MNNQQQSHTQLSNQLKRSVRDAEPTRYKLRDQPRLLVVDDEEAVCFSLEDYMGQHGYSVDTASNVADAQLLIETSEYEVILQDLRLGGTKVLEGLALISLAHRLNPRVRIVVLTAYGSDEIKAEACSCGASAFLLKPKPLPVVAQVIQGLLT